MTRLTRRASTSCSMRASGGVIGDELVPTRRGRGGIRSRRRDWDRRAMMFFSRACCRRGRARSMGSASSAHWASSRWKSGSEWASRGMSLKRPSRTLSKRSAQGSQAQMIFVRGDLEEMAVLGREAGCCQSSQRSREGSALRPTAKRAQRGEGCPPLLLFRLMDIGNSIIGRAANLNFPTVLRIRERARC